MTQQTLYSFIDIFLQAILQSTKFQSNRLPHYRIQDYQRIKEHIGGKKSTYFMSTLFLSLNRIFSGMLPSNHFYGYGYLWGCRF